MALSLSTNGFVECQDHRINPVFPFESEQFVHSFARVSVQPTKISNLRTLERSSCGFSECGSRHGNVLYSVILRYLVVPLERCQECSHPFPSRIIFPDFENGRFASRSSRDCGELNPSIREGCFFLFADGKHREVVEEFHGVL